VSPQQDKGDRLYVGNHASLRVARDFWLPAQVASDAVLSALADAAAAVIARAEPENSWSTAAGSISVSGSGRGCAAPAAVAGSTSSSGTASSSGSGAVASGGGGGGSGCGGGSGAVASGGGGSGAVASGGGGSGGGSLLGLSPRAAALRQRLIAFMDEHVRPWGCVCVCLKFDSRTRGCPRVGQHGHDPSRTRRAWPRSLACQVLSNPCACPCAYHTYTYTGVPGRGGAGGARYGARGEGPWPPLVKA
jgi:hypothetical protein